jgi:hypothetical protein
MADTGYKSPSANSGTRLTNPQNAYASDNTYATCTLVNNSDFHDYSGFGIEIPEGATIEGFEIAFEHKEEAPGWSSTDCICRFYKGEKATLNGLIEDASFLTSQAVEAYQTFGSSSTIPGSGTWAAGDFSDANFKISIRIRDSGDSGNDFYLDHIRLKVYYTSEVNLSLTIPTATIDLSAPVLSITKLLSLIIPTATINILSSNLLETLFHLWTNMSKNSATASNLTKHNSTFVNIVKNITSSFTNETKH